MQCVVVQNQAISLIEKLADLRPVRYAKSCSKIRTKHDRSLSWGARIDRLRQVGSRAWASVGAGEIMSGDYENRLEALYKQAPYEKEPEKLKQLISEILAVLEAHHQQLRDRRARSSDDKTS